MKAIFRKILIFVFIVGVFIAIIDAKGGGRGGGGRSGGRSKGSSSKSGWSISSWFGSKPSHSSSVSHAKPSYTGTHSKHSSSK